jgi:hypothetical protein
MLPIDNKNMSFTSGEGNQIPKVNSLAQFARKPLPTHTYRAESNISNGTALSPLPDEKDQYEQLQAEGIEESRLTKKERLKRTLQKHSDLKKKYQQLLRSKQEG